MYVLAINGSPRKKWNTATLLNKALEGAASQGAATELIHLYDLSFKGCISCFACKLIGGTSYGKCACQDGLTPVLEKVASADAVILGSPVYFGNVTGETRSFMERMLFPYLVYDEQHSSLVRNKKTIGLIYTMNIPENLLKDRGYDQVFQANESVFARVFGAAESLLATDTYQFSDYSRYVSTAFDEAGKVKRRKEEFPLDCEKAFTMGARLAKVR
jgi:Multimeric flavodoxin WrbA